MAQNVTIAGATYTGVPCVDIPKTGGGTARFTDATPTTAAVGDVVSGKVFIKANGDQATGTLVIQHYYTGSGAPSSSLGENGYIYLQTS